MTPHRDPPSSGPDFRALFEASPGLQLVLDRDLRVVAVSDAYLAATRTERGAIVGRGLFDVFPDDPDLPTASGVKNLRASLERVLATRRPDVMAVQRYDIRRPESEGGGFEERHWGPVNSPVLDADGRVLHIIHRVEDVTDFVRMERAGHADKRRVVHLESRAVAMEAEILRRAQAIQEADEELRLLKAELERRVLERTAELEASEARYRLLFVSNPHPMWVYDLATLAFLAVNEAACRQYGYTGAEFARMTLRDIRPPEDVPALLEDLGQPRERLNLPREWRHRRKDGSVLSVEISSHTLTFDGRDAVLVLATDVTRRKRLETQLLQSQKMESIGRLAGGIAHDFNNLLTAIIGHAELLKVRAGLEPGARHDLAEIEKASGRAANLTRQLLAFSRQQLLQPAVLDLNQVILDMDRMLRRLISEDIDLRTLTAADLGRVRADRGQLEQVLMNLVVNARDAMPDGGKLTIETGNLALDESYVATHDGLAAGPYVMLAVSDNGLGMTPEVRAHIFEPFFTTKDVGQGTGLGLSTVHGIVSQSGGHVEVYSEPGHGSTFKVYLPRVEQPIDAPAAESARSVVLGGTGTILVIEDEDQVREIVSRTLRLYGYTVFEAPDRSLAMRLWTQLTKGGTLVDLVISDVVMPGAGMRELLEHLRASRPSIRVLYMSGYTNRAITHQGLIADDAAFLQKPFTVEALLAKVHEILA